MSGPVLHSKFDSKNAHLASIILSLDTHQVQVKSVHSTQASLNTSFNLDKSNKVSNLTWISTSQDSVEVLALCLENGGILIYSPHTNEIISELTTSANVAVVDFHYSVVTKTAWSCDVQGGIYEWDVISYRLLRSFRISEIVESVESINRISSCLYNSEPHLLLASNSIYLYEIKTKQIRRTFPGHIQPITSIVSLANNMFITSAIGDRFMNLYELNKTTTKAIFVAHAAVSSFCIGSNQNESVLAAIVETGSVEVFNGPLSDTNLPSATPLKKKRKQVGAITHSSNSTIKLSRSSEESRNPQDVNLVINAISSDGDSLLFTWMESGTIPFFDLIKWVGSGNYLLDGNKTIIKNKADLKQSQSSSQYGHDVAASKLYNESHAVVNDGTSLADLEDESDGGTLAEKFDKLAMNKQQPQRKKKLEENRNGMSLSIILSQALQNNDHSLLETVLQTRDPQSIQNTISRLNPYSSVILLDRLSERIQRQSSRFSQLNYWLKWILVIHGSVIASLPNLNSKLYSLHSVLAKKANTLPRLLELQGRLNLLYDQSSLKQDLNKEEVFQDGEEEDVAYIEDLDDAQFNGEIDVDIDEVSSSEESDVEFEDEDDDDDEEQIASIDELENASDVEV
ncbi:Dip2/Utp12 family protein [Candida parapsilosis]|uniref:Dip2/Utp12 family protein n=1 Tax=Candida parapsilosis TaxID=5480 RepID=A0A8X7TCL0_CANPA|nr:Dip2/Utp12 family protein [Candida parapsilosis]KAF6055542.1 Dip2/Utp12 family protein [Candida parapsilosis]KAF6058472.1 Dip2/Utp12 family protein [Candida parapsilosis]KAF6067229.1 Dip2/Utp12 family protein [Candida parapsilosis]